MNQMKLQKALQAAGIDNRRSLRKGIADGEFKVNNTVIQDPNFMVDISKDVIRHLDKKIKLHVERKSYYIFNKPDGVVSTLDDPEGRPTLKDFTAGIKERVYPVGRLDYHSEGLILLTNDGDLTNFIISPRNKVPKVYNIKIKGALSEEERKKLVNKGIHIEGSRVKPLSIEFIRKTARNNSWIQVIIVEGKKHILRKVFKYTGHPVEKLKRVAVGTFKLKKLPTGYWRELAKEEVDTFRQKYGFKE
ncbi:MAG TPA: pseudouridine synthase [Candidatus Deferrimicrobium sp.]|nr:pseudouridine synthase [Candidatus Deferrimicrobium sp.]